MKERERVEAEEEHVEAARKKQEEERKKESQKVLINTQEMLCGICFFKYLFKLVLSCPMSCAAGGTYGDRRDAEAARRWEMLSCAALF